MSEYSFSDLHSCANEVIAILRGLPEFQNMNLAVIGGLALWKYLPTFRTTQDIDFIVTAQNAPKGVKEKLLKLTDSPFEDRAGVFVYRSSSGLEVQVDVTPDWQSPYLPAAAKSLSDLPLGTVPYISVEDLIVFKINSCGLRAEMAKKRRDANDARNLLDATSQSAPLKLDERQQGVVRGALGDVLKYEADEEAWWLERLGM